MVAKWGACAILCALLVLAGCRTPQPNLKPEKATELYTVPPQGEYTSSTLPKQALVSPADPSKFSLDAKSPGGLPNRASMGGMGGTPGMR